MSKFGINYKISKKVLGPKSGTIPDTDIETVEKAIEDLETRIESDPDMAMIESLMDLYSKAVEYYSATNNPRYEYYKDKIHNTLATPRVTDYLDSGRGSRRDEDYENTVNKRINKLLEENKYDADDEDNEIDAGHCNASRNNEHEVNKENEIEPTNVKQEEVDETPIITKVEENKLKNEETTEKNENKIEEIVKEEQIQPIENKEADIVQPVEENKKVEIVDHNQPIKEEAVQPIENEDKKEEILQSTENKSNEIEAVHSIEHEKEEIVQQQETNKDENNSENVIQKEEITKEEEVQPKEKSLELLEANNSEKIENPITEKEINIEPEMNVEEQKEEVSKEDNKEDKVEQPVFEQKVTINHETTEETKIQDNNSQPENHEPTNVTQNIQENVINQSPKKDSEDEHEKILEEIKQKAKEAKK